MQAEEKSRREAEEAARLQEQQRQFEEERLRLLEQQRLQQQQQQQQKKKKSKHKDKSSAVPAAPTPTSTSELHPSHKGLPASSHQSAARTQPKPEQQPKSRASEKTKNACKRPEPIGTNSPRAEKTKSRGQNNSTGSSAASPASGQTKSGSSPVPVKHAAAAGKAATCGATNQRGNNHTKANAASGASQAKPADNHVVKANGSPAAGVPHPKASGASQLKLNGAPAKLASVKCNNKEVKKPATPTQPQAKTASPELVSRQHAAAVQNSKKGKLASVILSPQDAAMAAKYSQSLMVNGLPHPPLPGGTPPANERGKKPRETAKSTSPEDRTSKTTEHLVCYSGHSLIKSPQSGVTLCFQFVSAAAATAITFASHIKTVWAKP